MKSVLVVGAGRVGRTIVHMLSAEGSYRIRVADADAVAAARVGREAERTEAFPESVEDRPALERAMEGCSAVVSAAPFTANPRIAEAARAKGVAYLDLTEDVEVTQFVKEVAEGAKTAFIPQCGVAPGFVTLAGTHIIEQFDEVDTLTLRVGALPEQPNNRLKYNLTWSTEGLVNEYLHPCEALRNGKLTLVPPLEQREEVIIGGVTYEAFTTSGGVGTLCHSCEGRIRQLDYKTIRYPGHLDLIRFLIDDLGFRDRPDELVTIFQRSIPSTLDDFVIVSVRGLGTSQGRYMEKTYWRRVNGRYLGKHFFTGIEVSTAAGVCGILHLLLLGDLPQKGLVMLEQVPYDRFMETPFGLYYARPGQVARPSS